ncbi:MAG TPA: tetraacyldisaccharide 4'-kinase [Stellaceae bacterium]|nr:tetraacyldisaccharide 4'-kinase [Stellaceae bacterium]
MIVRAPDFWERPGLASTLLLPLAGLNAAAGRIRHALARPWRAPVPVLCVGNLVAGGAGKTPTVLALAPLLTKGGRRPHILTRGYGGRLAGPVRVDPAQHGAADVGDEALLLARAAPCWIARDRVAGARAAITAGADLLLLDDGFQNPGLAKDFSLLAIDGAYGFGNERLIPAGPLREPLARGLARAEAALVIGPDKSGSEARIAGRLPVLHARLAAEGAAELRGRRVFAFAGIGRPAKFYATLRGLGAEIVGRRDFPDHHPYGEAEAEALLAAARTADAMPVTTAKDWVRLPASLRAAFRAVEVRLEWAEPDWAIELLAPFMLSPAPHG